MIKKVILSITLLIQSLAHSQVPIFPWCNTGTAHPIDIKMQTTLNQEDNSSFTMGVRDAQSEAHTAWSKEIEKLFLELKKIRPARIFCYCKKVKIIGKDLLTQNSSGFGQKLFLQTQDTAQMDLSGSHIFT